MLNDSSKGRNQEGYGPAYQFDLPYKDLVANTSTISEKSDKNQVVDESSWPHCGYGEAGYGNYGILSQNKNFTKDGHTVLCMDYGRFLIRAYMHCHNLYQHKKRDWSAAGPY